MLLNEFADRRLVELSEETAHLARARMSRKNDGVTFAELYAAMCESRTSRHTIEYRDLVANVATAGGYLASPRTAAAVNPLPPNSVAFQTGAIVDVRPVPSGGMVYPRWDALPTFEWLPTEATPLNSQTPPLGAVAASLKYGGAYIRISHLLNRQSDAVESLRGLLRQVVAVGVDQAFLNGSGSSGQPLGLLNTTGVQSVSGTALGWTGLTDLEESIALKDVDDEAISFVAHPGVRKLLRRREAIAGGGLPIWHENKLAGHPAFVSTSMPAGTLLGGDFSKSTIVLWGGVEVLVNPYEPTGFKMGRVDIAVFVALDVVTVYPAAFGKSVSIT